MEEAVAILTMGAFMSVTTRRPVESVKELKPEMSKRLSFYNFFVV